MTIRSPSNSRDLKVLNRLLVRNTIRRHGPIARYEVARATGLTPPTVTVIVNELIKEGVVEEVGRGESTGGRRPVMLELNPRAGYVVAARIQRGEAVVALLDLSGNVLRAERLALTDSAPAPVVDALAASAWSLLRQSGVERAKVLWCGVASPGLVDPVRGLVERSSNLAWERVPLGAMLSDRLQAIPVHVENISNAAALGEKFYGSGKGVPNLIYLNLSVGIGAGIIIDDRVYGGAKGYAGEVGHIALAPHGGPECTCGRRGCFEAVCGVRAVVARVKAEVSDEVFRRLGVDKTALTIRDVTSPPLVDTPEVRTVLRDVGITIGTVVANLISLFNTEMVILGGELAAAGDVLVDAVERSARERVIGEIADPVRIVRSTMSEDPPLMGAYALALEKVFQMERWESQRTPPVSTLRSPTASEA